MKTNQSRNILYITIVGMESCWLYALLSLIGNQMRVPLALFWLILLLPAAFIINKILPWKRRIYRYPVNGLVWVIATLIMVKIQLFGGLRWLEPTWLIALPQTFKPTALVIGGSLALWWLGFRLAHLRINFASSITEFQFGLTILLIVFFIASLIGSGLTSSIPIALAFFLFALAGMALTRNLDGEGWLAGANRGFWSGLLLAGIGLVLVLGILIGSLVTHDFLELILIPVKWVVGMLWRGIVFLLSLIPVPQLGELPPVEPAPDVAAIEAEELRNRFTIPEWLRVWLNRGYITLFLGLILAAIWRLSSQVLGWLRLKLATTSGAEVESMPGAFKQDLLAWLKHIWLGLLRLRLPFRKHREFEPAEEISTVRQIYRELLNWTAQKIYPRHFSQTPYEYLNLVEKLLPKAQTELRFITEEYVKARYSPALLNKETLHHLRETWHKLKQTSLMAANNETKREVALNE